jgi:hypothetical protein
MPLYFQSDQTLALARIVEYIPQKVLRLHHADRLSCNSSCNVCEKDQRASAYTQHCGTDLQTLISAELTLKGSNWTTGGKDTHPSYTLRQHHRQPGPMELMHVDSGACHKLYNSSDHKDEAAAVAGPACPARS